MNALTGVELCIKRMEAADLISFAADQLLELQKCGFDVAALTLTELSRRYRLALEQLSPPTDGQPAGE